MNIYCGCSGFHYDEWQGTFYPEDLDTDQLRGRLDKIRATEAAADYVYFDNTKHGQYVDNARRLLDLLDSDR